MGEISRGDQSNQLGTPESIVFESSDNEGRLSHEEIVALVTPIVIENIRFFEGNWVVSNEVHGLIEARNTGGYDATLADAKTIGLRDEHSDSKIDGRTRFTDLEATSLVLVDMVKEEALTTNLGSQDIVQVGIEIRKQLREMMN